MNLINNIKSVFQTTNKIIWMDINRIIVDPELEGIFIQKETEIHNIANNMIENQKNGKSAFDPAHPIILVHSKNHPELNEINADGMTRLKAAILAGLSKVAVIYREFANREELLKFVYEQSLLRRNLTEGEIFNAWIALNRLTNENGKKAKSDTEIAEELKISRRQVAKFKEVTRKSPELVEQVKSGVLTINKAYTQIKQEEAKAEESARPVVESEKKSKKTISKTPNLNYLNAYTEGWMYVCKSLRFGKSLNELQAELSELKAGTKSVESLQESLSVLKESYEQKQTE